MLSFSGDVFMIVKWKSAILPKDFSNKSALISTGFFLFFITIPLIVVYILRGNIEINQNSPLIFQIWHFWNFTGVDDNKKIYDLPGVLVGVLSLTNGQLSSSLCVLLTVKPKIFLISGGFSCIFLYEFISVGELLSSLLGVDIWERFFSALLGGPKTLYLCWWTGFKPGIEFGGVRRSVEASVVVIWISISWLELLFGDWSGGLMSCLRDEISLVCKQRQQRYYINVKETDNNLFHWYTENNGNSNNNNNNNINNNNNKNNRLE